MDFYQKLKPFTDFSDFSKEENYVAVPSDCVVVIADIHGSTKAIAEGKYKTINMIGASTIVAIANTIASLDFPFVFGGDGATALIHKSQQELVSRALRAVKENANNNFSINLRIGFVPVTNLSTTVKIAKYSLAGGPSIAFLNGGGWGEAEKLVKANQYLLLEDGPKVELSNVLKGLSCRWAPLNNKSGLMLTAIIKPNKIKAMEFEKMIRNICNILQIETTSAHPVKPENFNQEKYSKAVSIESKINNFNNCSKLKIYMQLFFVYLAKIFNLKINGYSLNNYIKENPAHSDYKKYDEVIRFVVDCSENTKNEVVKILESAFQNDEIYYGVHISTSALLTCFVQSFKPGNHIHFVDGNDGGYALAAKQLKQQISA